MAEAGRQYRLSIMLELQDRMQGAMQKAMDATNKFEEKLKKTSQAAKGLDKQKVSPLLTPRGDLDAKLKGNTKAAQALDRQRISPTLSVRDNATTRINSVQSNLRGLANKTYTVTLRAKDEASKVTGRIGGALTSTAGMVGLGTAAFGAGALIGGSLNKAMDFEAQLSSIKALTSASESEMTRIRALALKLGADTKFSALEAAQGFEELLKAGLSVEQVENGGALAALNLATAGGLDLAEAAEIMSTAMNAFKDDGLQAAKVADILAGNANASATGVRELRYSLAMVSAVASGVGMSFQDTNTALGLFANNGLKGSDAGTSLKTMLMNLVPNNKKAIEEFSRLGLMTERGTSAFFNQAGELKSLEEIAGLLQKSMAGMTKEQQLMSQQIMFGADAIRASNILFKEGAAGVRKFTGEMLKVTALDVAKEKMNNAKGSIVQLMSSFETLQIRAMSPFLPLVRKIANSLTDELKGSIDGTVDLMRYAAGSIDIFWDELASDEKFKAMDWGDKTVFVLDKMIAAVDKWSSGSGGEQMGKVFTKLAEIGMRSWMAAVTGMMQGSVNSLMSGNITGAIGLGMGASFLGGGALLKGGYSLGKGILGLGKKALPGKAATTVATTATSAGEVAATSSGVSRSASAWNGIKSVFTDSKKSVEINKAYAELKSTGLFGAGTQQKTGFLAKLSERGWSMAGKLTKFAKTPMGGFIKPLGVMLDAMYVAQADDKVKAAGGMAGRWGGAWLGAKAGTAAGAAIGTAVAPGVGTLAGGVLGGIGGSFAGFWGGGKIGESLAANLDFTAVQNKFTALRDNISASFAGDLKRNIDTAWENICQALSDWGNKASKIVTDCFASIPDTVGGYFSSAASSISGAWNGAKGYVSNKFGGLIKHADGGIFDTPHMALFAEAGAESIIPLSASRRSRALELWEQTGNMLGVKMYADGGITSSTRVSAPSTSSGGLTGVISGFANINIDNLTVTISNEMDEEAQALRIGHMLLNAIKRNTENYA